MKEHIEEPLSPEAQLTYLRMQTEVHGGLHEGQVLQLKHWPLIAMESAKTASFSFDSDKKVINYTLVLAKGAKVRKDTRDRLKFLAKNVQWLLGPTWCVNVRIRDQKFRFGPHQ